MEIIKYLKAHTCIRGKNWQQQQNRWRRRRRQRQRRWWWCRPGEQNHTNWMHDAVLFVVHTQNIHQTEFVARLCLIILDITGANLFHAFNTRLIPCCKRTNEWTNCASSYICFCYSSFSQQQQTWCAIYVQVRAACILWEMWNALSLSQINILSWHRKIVVIPH